MKLYITRPVSAGAHGSFAPGDTPDLPADVAVDLLTARKAIRYVAPVGPVEPVVETAAAAPAVETAAATPQVQKKRRAA